jgi:hypothetical protein
MSRPLGATGGLGAQRTRPEAKGSRRPPPRPGMAPPPSLLRAARNPRVRLPLRSRGREAHCAGVASIFTARLQVVLVRRHMGPALRVRVEVESLKADPGTMDGARPRMEVCRVKEDVEAAGGGRSTSSARRINPWCRHRRTHPSAAVLSAGASAAVLGAGRSGERGAARCWAVGLARGCSVLGERRFRGGDRVRRSGERVGVRLGARPRALLRRGARARARAGESGGGVAGKRWRG